MPTATAPTTSALPDLTAIRERKGISLEQIARNTKISCRYLEAIEKSEVDLLPGGVFRTSYIRQYARAIDYDEWDLLAYFRTIMRPQDDDSGAQEGPKFLGMSLPQPLARLFAFEKRV